MPARRDRRCAVSSARRTAPERRRELARWAFLIACWIGGAWLVGHDLEPTLTTFAGGSAGIGIGTLVLVCGEALASRRHRTLEPRSREPLTPH